jgi:hypothetical protein
MLDSDVLAFMSDVSLRCTYLSINKFKFAVNFTKNKHHHPAT